MAKSKSTGKPSVPLADSSQYVLRLYVTGSTAASLRAIQNLKRICETYLDKGYDLEIIDIFKRPDLARTAQIIAAPTLIKKLPGPLKRLIGDLSNEQKVLVGLDVHVTPEDKRS